MIYYRGNKSPYFEEKCEELAQAFKGSLKSSFSFENGEHGASAKFPTPEQEESFRDHLRSMASKLGLVVNFGGVVEL